MQAMRYILSCIAALELLEQEWLLYIGFSDEASLQGLNRK
jgi:hypothetical protein